MGIDIQTETVIGIGAGCREFPPNGVAGATMARYIQKGIGGIKLETIKIGGRRYTSKEAIARFIAAQNADEGTAAPAITPAQRRRQSEAARQALQEAGI
jgi:hypothetical protein